MHTPDTELHRAAEHTVLQIQNYICKAADTYFRYRTVCRTAGTHPRYRTTENQEHTSVTNYIKPQIHTPDTETMYRTARTYLLQIQNYRVAGTTPDTELYILQIRRYLLQIQNYHAGTYCTPYTDLCTE
jgi:hypothetical protein